MNRYRTPLFIIVAACAIAIPLGVSAQVGDFLGPIVPSEIQTCAANWGGLVLGLNNLIKFVLSFGVLVAVLTVAYAGFLLVLSPTNPENRGTARGLLINAAIGLVIALAAWLIVNTILIALTGGKNIGTFTGFLSSSADVCIQTKGNLNPQGPSSGSLSGSSGSGTCTNCASLASAGISHKPKGTSCGASAACNVNGGCDGVPAQNPPLEGCVVNKDLADKLKTSMKSGMWVTEAWPPTRDHANPCHASGTCVDVDFTDNRQDAASIKSFIESAGSAGLGVVYELPSVAACQALRDSGVPEKNLDVVAGITGSHFSVYNSPVSSQPGCK